jgi:hypothetical protein
MPAAHIPSCLIGNQHLGPAITMPCRPEMHSHVHSSWDVVQILHNCLLLCLPAVVGPGTSVAVIRCLLRRWGATRLSLSLTVKPSSVQLTA